MFQFYTPWKLYKIVHMVLWGFQRVENWNIGSKLVQWVDLSTWRLTRNYYPNASKKNLFNNLLTPQTRARAHAHTHTHTDKHTQTHRTDRHTQTQRTDRHTQTHTDTQTHYPDYRLYPNLYIIQTNATHFILSGTSKFVIST